MLTTLYGTRDQLPPSEEAGLAVYRYAVFVQTLGWNLPCASELERDRFDGPETVYIIAKDESGRICGCARLLPTTQPYLLVEMSPQLLSGMQAPRSKEIWELSRFATQPLPPDRCLPRDEARQRFRIVFAAVVRSALECGATRLITFTALGIERILRVIGIHAHRVGPPMAIEGKPVVALWIELDRKTCDALDMSDLHSTAPGRDSSSSRLSECV
jgi:N-acyl-L-homoserine lactone synthetase